MIMMFKPIRPSWRCITAEYERIRVLCFTRHYKETLMRLMPFCLILIEEYVSTYKFQHKEVDRS